jgi:hypothetical protein
MKNLIQTITGQSYSQVDSRVFDHDGAIVDLGCMHWDWSKIFIGKKDVIGADPFEKKCPSGVRLFTGAVLPFDGKIKMIKDGDASRIASEPIEGDWIEGISWKNFCTMFDIQNISILKMNIEGSEYSLLHSMDADDFSKIDQLAISFHDWLNPSWRNLTQSAIHLLNLHGFEVELIGPYGWHLAVRSK